MHWRRWPACILPGCQVFRRSPRVHFVGIGGIGMSGIAEVLCSLGHQVSGSDLKASDITERLQSLGVTVTTGHSVEHLGDADVVVISSAVAADNPEVLAARQRRIPVIARAEMLGELMRMKSGIAVAGSHGKTTTTSLVAQLLAEAKLDPTVIVGGKLPALGSSARLGQGEFLVAEADESDGSFLQLSPTIAVVTNIDAEHLDHYGSMVALERTFVAFLSKLPFYGLAVLCSDDPVVKKLLPTIEKRTVTYGLLTGSEISATDLEFSGLRSKFTLVVRGKTLGPVELNLPGRHNVQNALGAFAVAEFLGIDFATVRKTLSEFVGPRRRFTVRGEESGVMVVEDYGHHPAEIRATLAAARAGFADRRIVVAFQPHRYSRTRDLFDEFVAAFSDAERVFVTDIYSAGEPALPGICSASLVKKMSDRPKPEVSYVADRKELAARLGDELRPGDLFIALGAGDIGQMCDELLSSLRGRRAR